MWQGAAEALLTLAKQSQAEREKQPVAMAVLSRLQYRPLQRSWVKACNAPNTRDYGYHIQIAPLNELLDALPGWITNHLAIPNSHPILLPHALTQPAERLYPISRRDRPYCSQCRLLRPRPAPFGSAPGPLRSAPQPLAGRT